MQVRAATGPAQAAAGPAQAVASAGRRRGCGTRESMGAGPAGEPRAPRRRVDGDPTHVVPDELDLTGMHADRADSDPAVGAFRAAGDSEDDDHVALDQVDDPQVTDPKTPEAGSREPGRTRRMGFDRQREDRTSEARSVAGWEPAELTLCGGRQLDPASAAGHSGSSP
jgi:hypothetical protein